MTSVLLLIAGILLLLFFWAGRQWLELPGDLESPLDISSYAVRLPPRTLFSRCLSTEDVAFVNSLASPPVLRLLLHERRRLALHWLRLTRREAARLFSLHLRAVRHAIDLRPITEVRLLLQVSLFFILYETMVGMLRLYGPFRTRAFVRTVQRLADLLSALGGRIAETVAPVPVQTMRVAGNS